MLTTLQCMGNDIMHTVRWPQMKQVHNLKDSLLCSTKWWSFINYDLLTVCILWLWKYQIELQGITDKSFDHSVQSSHQGGFVIVDYRVNSVHFKIFLRECVSYLESFYLLPINCLVHIIAMLLALRLSSLPIGQEFSVKQEAIRKES